MGIVSSNKGFLESFEQIQQIDDQYFENICIFHSTELNKYIFKASRTYIVNDPRHQNFQKQVKCLQQLQDNPTIMPLLFHEVKQYRNFCVDYQIVQMYCQYFNFTLNDMLRTGKGLDISQLWLCLRQLLSMVDAISKINLQFQFDLKDIFITLKGNLTIYPISFNFYQYSSSHKLLKNIVICILKLATNETNLSITAMLEKLENNSHFKNLVKFLQYMLETENNKDIFQELLEGLEEMKKNGVMKIANEIKLNKFRYIIPSTENSQEISNKEGQKQKNQNQKNTVAIGKSKIKANTQRTVDSVNKSKVEQIDSNKEQKQLIQPSTHNLQQSKQQHKELTRTKTNLENLTKLKKQLQKFQSITPIGLVKRVAPPRMLSQLEQKKMENLANRVKMQQRRKQLLHKTSSQNTSLQASKAKASQSKNKQNISTSQHSFKSSKKIIEDNFNKKIVGFSHNKFHNNSNRR